MTRQQIFTETPNAWKRPPNAIGKILISRKHKNLGGRLFVNALDVATAIADIGIPNGWAETTLLARVYDTLFTPHPGEKYRRINVDFRDAILKATRRRVADRGIPAKSKHVKVLIKQVKNAITKRQKRHEKDSRSRKNAAPLNPKDVLKARRQEYRRVFDRHKVPQRIVRLIEQDPEVGWAAERALALNASALGMK